MTLTRTERIEQKTRHQQAGTVAAGFEQLAISPVPVPLGDQMKRYLLDALYHAFWRRNFQPLRLPEHLRHADTIYASRGVEWLLPRGVWWTGWDEADVSYGKFEVHLLYRWLTYVQAHPLPLEAGRSDQPDYTAPAYRKLYPWG